MRDLFLRMAKYLMSEHGFSAGHSDVAVKQMAKSAAGEVGPALLMAEWLGRNPEAADWLAAELRDLQATVDSRGRTPAGHPRSLAAGIFRVAFDPRNPEFTECKLLEGVGGMLKVQEVNARKPGKITLIHPEAVHPDDRAAVLVMAQAQPAFNAKLLWEDETPAEPPLPEPEVHPEALDDSNFQVG